MQSQLVRRVGVAAAFVLVLAGCTSTGNGGDDAAPTTAPGATAGGAPLARYADYHTLNYDDPSHWLCRPGADDICASDLDATVVQADGTLTVDPFVPAADPPIDCFYVYPTISKDPSTFSDWQASPDEEGYAAVNQAARLRSQCRVFAPVYRQLTSAGLAGVMGRGDSAPGGEFNDPYADVLDAFRTYMAEDNHGRGVVLIGHSQGSAMLERLVAEEVDPNADVRDELVAAYLAGWPVAVPPGAEVGGDFQNIPVCRQGDQTGCVLAWSSFRSTSPPPADAVFGRVRGGGSDVAVCASPAAVAGEGDNLKAYFPSSAKPSILASLGTTTNASGWVDPSVATVTTPYVAIPGLVTGTCASTDGFNYLSVDVHGDPGDPRADDIVGDLSPQWGLHLIDVSLEMGNIVDLVGQQSASYQAGSS